MARLPTPKSDDGIWGDVLNDFLQVAHNGDGTLKDTDIVAAKYVKPALGIPESDLDTSVQTKLNAGGSVVDATTTTRGIVQLAGDLSGTATSPTVANSAVTSAKIADNAVTNAKIAGSIDQAKVTNLTTDIAAKYTLPGTGMPLGDLSASVQTSLGLADSASQPSHTHSYSATGHSHTESDISDLVHKSNLDSLNDVSIAAPSNGDVLTFNGTGWVSGSGTGGGTTTSHSALDDLANDDHAQYHNDTRGDARYYTQTQLNAGQLDSRYYTETEADAAITAHSSDTTAVHGIADTANIILEGDSRLTDNRNPNAHSHTESEISDLAHKTTIESLDNVTVTTPGAGQILKYDGVGWINDADSAGEQQVINHGSDANFARPAISNPIIWIGSAQPVNLGANDAWLGPSPEKYLLIKASDTARDSTPKVDDPELTTTVTANKTYIVKLNFVAIGSADNDFKLGWTAPAGATMMWQCDTRDMVSASGGQATQTFNARDIGDTQAVGLAGTTLSNRMSGQVFGVLRVSTTGGTFALSWGKVSNTDTLTDTTLLADSVLEVTEVTG